MQTLEGMRVYEQQVSSSCGHYHLDAELTIIWYRNGNKYCSHARHRFPETFSSSE